VSSLVCVSIRARLFRAATVHICIYIELRSPCLTFVGEGGFQQGFLCCSSSLQICFFLRVSRPGMFWKIQTCKITLCNCRLVFDAVLELDNRSSDEQGNLDAIITLVHIPPSVDNFLLLQHTPYKPRNERLFLLRVVPQDSPLKGIQMLWVNLLMDTLASLSLATERPTNSLLNRQPYSFHEPIVSPLMLRNIFSHAAYELTVLLVILFAGSFPLVKPLKAVLHPP
jgi:Cation transporting ATPase, C-terminus